MAWNARETKSLNAAPSVKSAQVPLGAPVALNAGVVGRGYTDGWDIQRAYAEGMAKVVWVSRAIDAIAGNQARLPIVLRKDNSPEGEIVRSKNPLLDVLNSKSNPGENSFVFRYRLTAQTLLSSRGAFIEKVRGRDGRIIALQLLPPQFTAPIPDPRTFVSGYEVIIPGGGKTILKPENVIWVRRPHPLDPYLSLTPMEAAGIAIEIENLAKVYNRNFLLNDGRPGGLLVVRGDMEDDDKEELRSRFRGNMNRVGSTTVIASEDGVDFVDTSSNPRDAAYVEMRRITKEEILSAFGVPETAIGNAGGKCLRHSELVRLASGERVPAGQLVGQHFRLLTSTADGHIEVPAWATLEQIETIYQVTTESGRQLEVNGRHPLFAARYIPTKDAGWQSAKGPRLEIEEWTPVSKLVDGEWVIAVPTVVTPTSSNQLSEDEGFVLGALVGDGTMTGDRKPVALSTPEGAFAKEFVRAVEALGDDVIHVTSGVRVDVWRVKGKPENRKGSGRGARNSVRTRVLLRNVGLMGTTSHTKFIPEQIFGSSNATLAAFLGGLFAADGSVHLGSPSGAKDPYGKTSISLTTVSERLARDVQEALLRFGVQSRLRHRENLKSGFEVHGDRRFSAWTVTVADAQSLLNFAAFIAVPGKQDKLDLAATRADERMCRGRIEGWRTRGLNPGLAWERVASVKEVGIDQTVGIAVPDYHTYLSVFWEHNTFANAGEEMRVFWMETMSPHLDMLARALDELDEEFYIDFDTSDVPILIIAKQERERYLMEEHKAGLISANEYRQGSGRKLVKSELADSLLANPNLAPIANTEKEFKQEQQMPVDAPAGGPGPATPGAPAAPEGSPPLTDPFAETPGEPVPAGQSSAEAVGQFGTKSDMPDEWDLKAEESSDRWTEIMALTLARVVERQERVVTEKALGAKARKMLTAGTLTADAVFDVATWNRQLVEDVRPVLAAIVSEGASSVDSVVGQKSDLDDPAVQAYLDEQMARIQEVNQTTKGEIQAALVTAMAAIGGGEEEDGHLLLKMALVAVFADLHHKRKQAIAEHESQTAFNFGVHYAAQNAGDMVTKTWKTRRDNRVRSTHAFLEGKSVPVGGSFAVAGTLLRFPGDPAAPMSLTAGCRCRLKFNRNTAN